MVLKVCYQNYTQNKHLLHTQERTERILPQSKLDNSRGWGLTPATALQTNRVDKQYTLSVADMK